MAMSITIAINVDENQRFTPVESAVIAALQQGTTGVTAAADKAGIEAGLPVVENIAQGDAVEAAPAAEEKPAPRRRRSTKAAPAPEAEESTTPAVLDTTLDEAPDEQAIVDAAEEKAEDIAEAAAAAAEGETITLEQAVTIATDIIGKGGKQKVKDALAELGVGRVTELKGNDEGLAKFVTLIQA